MGVVSEFWESTAAPRGWGLGASGRGDWFPLLESVAAAVVGSSLLLCGSRIFWDDGALATAQGRLHELGASSFGEMFRGIPLRTLGGAPLETEGARRTELEAAAFVVLLDAQRCPTLRCVAK